MQRHTMDSDATSHRFHEEFNRISAASVLLIRVGIQPRNGLSADFRYVFMCSVVR